MDTILNRHVRILLASAMWLGDVLVASSAAPSADHASYHRHQRGSLVELSWGGTEPLTLADGCTRTFLDDGPTATVSGARRLTAAEIRCPPFEQT